MLLKPCLRLPIVPAIHRPSKCLYSTTKSPPVPKPDLNPRDDAASPKQDEEPSAMARRLSSLAEDAILSSPRSAAKIAPESALADEVKAALADRLVAAEFRSTHAQAHSIASLPSSAPKHTRDLAATRPWDGTESTEDAVLRMLHDSKPLLKGDLAKRSTPNPVDFRPSAPRPTGGLRVARAKEASLGYSLNRDAGLTPEERAQVRQMFRDRFRPEGRPVATLQALMSLADQRIEDARARGQFDNIPRGKPIKKDHNASSPYIDTTEYYLNKIIQRQNILPPWVEKQQEVQRAVESFRGRLRYDWKRFAARSIAARGGTLQEQCDRADRYAAAEARRVRLDAVNQKLRLGEEVTAEEQAAAAEGPTELFRDPEWAKAEASYNALQIENLNSLTRSYNLLAPELAKKPYYNLDRELQKCYADVAPLVAAEIRERAASPKGKGMLGGETREKAGLKGMLGLGHVPEIYDDPRPAYGFKDFWKDLFKRK